MSSCRNLWIALALASCAPTPPPRPPWIEPTPRPRPGVVASVDKLEEHGASDASSDVFLGVVVGSLLLSGLLLHRGTGRVVGIDEGESAIAGPDGGTSALPRYQVVVRFDDGGSMKLVYTNDVPFQRGERVVLTRQGLVSAG